MFIHVLVSLFLLVFLVQILFDGLSVLFFGVLFLFFVELKLIGPSHLSVLGVGKVFC